MCSKQCIYFISVSRVGSWSKRSRDQKEEASYHIGQGVKRRPEIAPLEREAL